MHGRSKRYCLPLMALVETMRSSPHHVVLQTQLATLPGVSKRSCVAQVLLGQGAVHTCTIWGEAGTVLVQQQAAYEALARCGDLEWEMVATPVTTRTAERQYGASVIGTSGEPEMREEPWSIPTLRVTPLPRDVLAAFPHGSRIALVLIDGKRSMAEIAHLLNKTPQEIQQIFAQMPNLVTW
ncbi:MAG: hypothetical protein ACRDHZ_01955 [Ktedonobacteraceae bacterium]